MTSSFHIYLFLQKCGCTVKPLIKNTSDESIKCRLDNFSMSFIDFNKFVEILSGPELFLLFSVFRVSFIISGVIFAKTKFSSVPYDKKSENCLLVPLIVVARSGPILN